MRIDYSLEKEWYEVSTLYVGSYVQIKGYPEHIWKIVKERDDKTVALMNVLTKDVIGVESNRHCRVYCPRQILK